MRSNSECAVAYVTLADTPEFAPDGQRWAVSAEQNTPRNVGIGKYILVCDHISFMFVRLSDAHLVRTVHNAPRLKQKPSKLY